jgi:hypothetical protein
VLLVCITIASIDVGHCIATLARGIAVLMLHQGAEIRFHVLTATSMMVAVFWNVAACKLVEIGRSLP